MSNLKIIQAWYRRASRATWCHHTAATIYNGSSTLIGVSIIILTMLVTIFTKDGSNSIAVVVYSSIAGALASAQTFLKFPERALVHKDNGASYAITRRRIEKVYAEFKKGADISSEVNEIENLLNEQGRGSATIPWIIWIWAERKYNLSKYKSPLE